MNAGLVTEDVDEEIEVIWRPQPGPQTVLCQLPYDEMFFGGARGGGKTSGILGHWLKHADEWGAYAKGVLFRHTNPQLEEVKDQAKLLFEKLDARYKDQNGKKMWVFPNGARLMFSHLEYEKHAKDHQGKAYTWQGWEELTNWQSPSVVDRVSASLRSSHGVKCQWIGTGNPGGPGHNWVKDRFITPAPPLVPHYDSVKEVWRIFIPSKLTDNRILMESDPGYASRLKGTGPDWLVKAWLEGNWDIVAGGMFDDLWKDEVHAISPFKIPSHWKVERAFDWGSSRPFSVGWWTTADGNPVKLPNGQVLYFYKGTKIRISEWYGWDGKTPNKGLNLVDIDIARRAVQLEHAIEQAHGVRIQEGPADPSIFAVVNGKSIGATLSAAGLHFTAAATGPNSRVIGWETMRRMLKASLTHPMEAPGLFVFNSCRQFIRTVPTLPRDSSKIDDVDTESEDHIGDETRYALTQLERTVTMQKMPV